MNISFSLAISHTPWVPERVESLAKLVGQLGTGLALKGDFGEPAKLFQEREPNHIWSEKMWRWASGQDVSHCIFLQDDVRVAPYFWQAIKAMVEARPESVIGLESAHPSAVPLSREGHNFYTTSDGLIGPGYIVPRALLPLFLEWRQNNIKKEIMHSLVEGRIKDGEDTLLGLWCLATDQRIWCPLPTVIDHDVKIASTYGNDWHGNRRPPVRWDNYIVDGIRSKEEALTSVDFWTWGTGRHVGRMYEATPKLLAEWLVTPLSQEDQRRVERDNGFAEMRRLLYAMRGLDAAERETPLPRILVCVPSSSGQVHTITAESLMRLSRDEQCEVEAPFWAEEHFVTQDITKTRARMVAQFLRNTDADFMLFLDADVGFSPWAFRGMLDACQRGGYGFVGCPYPRRDHLDFQRIDANASAGDGKVAPEAAGMRYSIQYLDTGPTPPDNFACFPVKRIPLGCCLLSRALLQKASEYYKDLDRYDDATGLVFPRLFRLADTEMASGRVGELSEDYSFCDRIREMGEKVYCYLGNGSPVDHASGSFVFKGHVESFGLRRA